MVDRKDQRETKISPQFRASLSRLGGRQKIRAILMLKTEDVRARRGGRQTPAERRQVIDSVRESAAAAFPEIDDVLERFDGRRLADGVDALGTIPVETTAKGISALAELNPVKVIFEDQKVSLIKSLP